MFLALLAVLDSHPVMHIGASCHVAVEENMHIYGHKLSCCADVCSRTDTWLDKLGQSGPAISADAPFPASIAY